MEPQDLDTIIDTLCGDIEATRKASLHLEKNIESINEQIEKYKKLGLEIEEEITKAKKDLESHTKNINNGVDQSEI